jgi:hypothetical protein
MKRRKPAAGERLVERADGPLRRPAKVASSVPTSSRPPAKTALAAEAPSSVDKRPAGAPDHAKAAVGHGHLPPRWMIPIVAVVAPLVTFLDLYSPGGRLLLTAESDFVSFGLTSNAHVSQLRVRGLVLSGVAQVQTPYGDADVSPSTHLAVGALPVPAPGGAPLAVPDDRVPLDLTAPTNAVLSFERLHEGIGGAYQIRITSGAEAPTTLDITLQRGQAILTDPPLPRLSQTQNDPVPVTFVAAAGRGLVLHFKIDGEAAFIPPFAIQSVDFLQASPLQSGEITGLSSRLVGATVTWLDVGGKQNHVPAGSTLTLQNPRGGIADLSLRPDELAFTFSGTARAVSSTIAGIESSLAPSALEWIAASPFGRIVLGAVPIFAALLGVAKWWRMHREASRGPGAPST